MAQTIYFSGVLIGAFVFGFIADRWVDHQCLIPFLKLLLVPTRTFSGLKWGVCVYSLCNIFIIVMILRCKWTLNYFVLCIQMVYLESVEIFIEKILSRQCRIFIECSGILSKTRPLLDPLRSALCIMTFLVEDVSGRLRKIPDKRTREQYFFLSVLL